MLSHNNETDAFGLPTQKAILLKSLRDTLTKNIHCRCHEAKISQKREAM